MCLVIGRTCCFHGVGIFCFTMREKQNVLHFATAPIYVANAQSCKTELNESGLHWNARLTKPEVLVLRGKLGFADSFVHGRLGSLVLKKLAEHAYDRSAKLDLGGFFTAHVGET